VNSPDFSLATSSELWDSLRIPAVDKRAYRLSERAGISIFLTQLLLNRGIDTPEAIAAWLDPNPPLPWPEAPFTDALRARFLTALETHEKIAIHGDYDADGLTGTTLLYQFLTSAGAQVTPFLPTRALGYGLNITTLEQFAADGITLLITVDCGISNAVEIARAQALGMTVIITDHHGLPETLPDTPFILHPKVLHIPEVDNLAGVGVACWLATLLYPALQARGALNPEELYDLVALGTVADMTPLQGFNRDLVKQSLRCLHQSQRPGLQALAHAKKLTMSDLTEEDLSFRMIPALNAAGRIESPQLALDLLLATTADEAQTRVSVLEALNLRRQEICRTVAHDAHAQIEAQGLGPAIVLSSPDWLHGVLGIVCAQLVEAYQVPVVLIACEGEVGKASVRSPAGMDCLAALTACGSLLLRFGGHAQAGGFSIDIPQIPAFAQAFENYVMEHQQIAAPQHPVELEINPRLLTLALYTDLRRLAPFGMGNPAPQFLSLGIPIQQARSDKQHKHLFVDLSPQVTLTAWNSWQAAFQQADSLDAIYTLSIDRWQGKNKLLLQAHHLRARLTDSAPPLPEPEAEPQRPLDILTAAPRPALAQQLAHRADQCHGWYLINRQGESLRLPSGSGSEAAPVWHDLRSWRQLALALDSLETDFALMAPLSHAPGPGTDTAPTTLVLLGPPHPGQPLQPLLSRFQHIVIAHDPLTETLLPFGFDQLLNLAPLLDGKTEEEIFQLALPVAPWLFSWMYKTLCDLGVLTYDRGRCRIEYAHQKYQLRDSAAYCNYLSALNQRNALGERWRSTALITLKEWIEDTHD
jgi:single-stranded-DNA-specific exonuclease